MCKMTRDSWLGRRKSETSLTSWLLNHHRGLINSSLFQGAIKEEWCPDESHHGPRPSCLLNGLLVEDASLRAVDEGIVGRVVLRLSQALQWNGDSLAP